MDIKNIVKRAIDEMHVRAIETELRQMQAGEVEYLKQECAITGDIKSLARFLWQQYQTV